MIGLLCFVLAVLAALIKSKMRLEAENAVLRHQLTVLRHRLQGRVRLTNADRWVLIVLYRWFPSLLGIVGRATGVKSTKKLSDDLRRLAPMLRSTGIQVGEMRIAYSIAYACQRCKIGNYPTISCWWGR